MLKMVFICRVQLRNANVYHLVPHSPMMLNQISYNMIFTKRGAIRSFHSHKNSQSNFSIFRLNAILSLPPLECPIKCFDFFSSSFTRMTVTFKQENLMTSVRIELHSMADFLGNLMHVIKLIRSTTKICDSLNNLLTIIANSGGLFGLFMGASLISLIEFIYYFTLRLFYARRAERSKTKLAALTTPKSIFTVLPKYKL